MDISFEDQIRERAYHIWQAGGMADGQAHEHWISAELAMRHETVVSAEPEVILTKAKPTKAPAKVKAQTAKAPTAKTSTAKISTAKSASAKPKAPVKAVAATKAPRARKAASAVQAAL